MNRRAQRSVLVENKSATVISKPGGGVRRHNTEQRAPVPILDGFADREPDLAEDPRQGVVRCRPFSKGPGIPPKLPRAVEAGGGSRSPGPRQSNLYPQWMSTQPSWGLVGTILGGSGGLPFDKSVDDIRDEFTRPDGVVPGQANRVPLAEGAYGSNSIQLGRRRSSPRAQGTVPAGTRVREQGSRG